MEWIIIFFLVFPGNIHKTVSDVTETGQYNTERSISADMMEIFTTTGQGQQSDPKTVESNEKTVDSASTSNSTIIWHELGSERAEQGKQTKTPEWIKALDITQAACSIIGFTANCITFLTLTKSSSGLGPAVRTLLRHQSAIDAIVCMFAAILILSPPMWTSGNYILDLIVCHIWHSQIAYWDLYLISIWNLVIVAIERFICVAKPLTHDSLMSPRRIRVVLVVLHILSPLICGLGFLQVRFNGTFCVSEYAFAILSEAFYVYGFFVFSLWHFIPVVLFLVFYGYVIIKLKGRVQGNLPKSSIIEKASKQLTKTAIVVTLVFMFSTSFDTWYYLLGRTGAVIYTKNSPLQKAGVFLSILNCCANPFVYVMMMPVYRKNMVKTLLCQGENEEKSSLQHGTNSQEATNASTSITDIKVDAKL